MIKLILFTIAHFFSFNAISMDTTENIVEHEFVFVTDGNYPPYTFVNEQNEIDGVETALLKEACKIAGIRCRFHYRDENGILLDFAVLLPGVLNKSWDAAYGDVGIFADRVLAGHRFVPSVKVAKFFLGKSSSVLVNIPDDLSGKTIGTQVGTKFVDYVEKLSAALTESGKPGITIKKYDSLDKIKDALLAGEFEFTPHPDGVISSITAEPKFSDYSKVGPELITGFAGVLLGNFGSGFAFNSSSKARYYIGQAMNSIHLSCKYSEISYKYLGAKGLVNLNVPDHCKKNGLEK